MNRLQIDKHITSRPKCFMIFQGVLQYRVTVGNAYLPITYFAQIVPIACSVQIYETTAVMDERDFTKYKAS